jgi:ribosomal protein S6
MTVYEIGFLLIPIVREEEVSTHVATLKEFIAQGQGAIVSEEKPVLIELAYEMIKVLENKNKRFTTGYFGWLKFEMEAQAMPEFKKKVDELTVVLRSIIVKTVKENTVFSKKSLGETLKITATDAEFDTSDVASIDDNTLEEIDPAIASMDAIEEALPADSVTASPEA